MEVERSQTELWITRYGFSKFEGIINRGEECHGEEMI
ncbi:hypothetical protein EE612_046985 [Oryza sativa]|nr:hypothetical protein EE612_046985 [Oryza sativa]